MLSTARNQFHRGVSGSAAAGPETRRPSFIHRSERQPHRKPLHGPPTEADALSDDGRLQLAPWSCFLPRGNADGGAHAGPPRACRPGQWGLHVAVIPKRRAKKKGAAGLRTAPETAKPVAAF